MARDHGRIEEKEVFVCHSVDWLTGSKHDPDEPKFSHLSILAMTLSNVEENGNLSQSKLFYISSASLSVEPIGNAIRAHWGIEDSLH